eukprot:3165675-Rhodomonas_salina.1
MRMLDFNLAAWSRPGALTVAHTVHTALIFSAKSKAGNCIPGVVVPSAHECGLAGNESDMFCFVYDEQTQRFIAWGHLSELHFQVQVA